MYVKSLIERSAVAAQNWFDKFDDLGKGGSSNDTPAKD